MKLPGALAERLGRVTRAERVGGGNTHPAYRLETATGTFFVKLARAEEGLFAGEARSLEALRSSRTSLRIPRVEAAGNDFLCLEWLEPGRHRDHDVALGTGLAELHAQTAPQFGFEADTFCGPTRQPNAWHDRFVSFWGEARLRVVLTLAHQRGALAAAERLEVERLIQRLPELLAAVTGPPRLIHGDLWSGNVLETAAGPALVDPAAAYSHPEAELGMMLLFGGFSERTLDAYRERLPLESHWRERIPLFQLYHLLNHAALFGGGYSAQAMTVVHRFS